MPFIQVTTRQPLPQPTKATLAEALSTAMLDIEIGGPTEAAKRRDWIWFQVLPAADWAVGGRLDDAYVNGRTMCFARIIAPEGFLNTQLKHQAIGRVTQEIRKALAIPQDDDGSGIWVHVVEVDEGQWGSAGVADPLMTLIAGMGGYVSPERRIEMASHFEGIEQMKSHFGIPK